MPGFIDQLAYETGLSVEDAEKGLRDLIAAGAIEMRIEDDCVLIRPTTPEEQDRG